MTDLEVVTVGELLGVVEPLDLLSRLESAVLLQKSIGGTEVNVALTLARLGHRVGWAGAVGDDPFGRLGIRTLRGEGVDVSRVVVNGSAPTGVYFKEVLALGGLDNHPYRAGSAASLATHRDFDTDYLLSGRVLHLSGITAAISSAGQECVAYLAGQARRRGVHLSVDANVRRRLLHGRDAKKLLTPLLRAADTLFLSRSESVLLLSTDEPTRLQALLKSLAATTIVIHDPRGACAITDQGIARIDARTVNVVDPTGAGDALVAGYLSSWLEDASVTDCLQRAEHCAAHAVASRGDNAVGVTRISPRTSCDGEVDIR
ncbi:MAG: sugar kinase [Nocardioidaceae bacterium]|nr:sugar kinase [Nocardioidaceae bacterium]